MLYKLLRKWLKISKCCRCGKWTRTKHPFADDIDEEGQPTGYMDYCCDECFNYFLERL